MTSITVRATEEHRHQQEGSRTREEHVRAGSGLVDVRAPHRDHAELARAQVRQQAGDLRGERRGVQGRLQLRRDHRAVRAVLPGGCRPGRSRAPIATSRGRRRCRGAWWRPPSAADCTLFYASYPITPASELLHELSRHKNFGVITLQAEDEIAAANMALGAAFAGDLAVTGTSGPGMDLKAETLGPGRDHGAADGHRRRPARRPVHRPAHQDRAGRPAARDVRPPRRVARCRSWRRPRRRTASPSRWRRRGSRCATARPVIVLSDTFLSNSSEPWKVPEVDDLPLIEPNFAHGQRRRVPAVRARRAARAPVGHARAPRASCTGSVASSARTAPATSATTPRTTSA